MMLIWYWCVQATILKFFEWMVGWMGGWMIGDLLETIIHYRVEIESANSVIN